MQPFNDIYISFFLLGGPENAQCMIIAWLVYKRLLS